MDLIRSFARVLLVIVGLVAISLVCARLMYPDVVAENWAKWEIPRLRAKLKKLKAADSEKASRYQGFLVHCIQPTRARDMGARLISGENYSNALLILGRLESPSEATLRAMISRMVPVTPSKGGYPRYQNRGMITALGRIGPGAKAVQADLVALTGNQYGQAEAINRISGEAPVSFSSGEKAPYGNSPQIKVPGLRGWAGEMSKIEDERVRLVRTAGEWEVLWRAHAGSASPPAVDFREKMILAYFHGATWNGMNPVFEDLKLGGSMTITIHVGYSDAIDSTPAFPFLMVELPANKLPIIVNKRWYQAMGRDGDQHKELARFEAS